MTVEGRLAVIHAKAAEDPRSWVSTINFCLSAISVPERWKVRYKIPEPGDDASNPMQAFLLSDYQAEEEAGDGISSYLTRFFDRACRQWGIEEVREIVCRVFASRTPPSPSKPDRRNRPRVTDDVGTLPAVVEYLDDACGREDLKTALQSASISCK